MTSGFHLWQFQVFNSGAEALVVVLFWLDLGKIFFLATPRFEPWTSGSLVLHSTTVQDDFWFSPLSISGIYLWCRGISGGIGLIGPVKDYLFGHIGVWTCYLWISSPALYHCTTVTFGFHLWQFQVFNSGAEGLVVVLFWLDMWEIFFLVTLRVWTQDLQIFSPALYHCTTVTSGFHLWQFQVFKYGPEGLVVVLFWLDLWEIFFLATSGFEPGTSGSLVLHSTTVPRWWLLVFTSDNFRYLNLVQRDWWWYCSDWTCEEIFFLATLGFEPWTSGSLVLHSTTVPQWLLVFTSHNIRYLTMVQRDWWWYCSDWTCERFPFWPTRVWPQDIWITSPVLYYCIMVTSGFHLWQFQVFNSGAEGLVVVFFWLNLWEIFFLATLGFEPGTSGSLVLHSTTAPQWLLVLPSDNFRYLTLVQRDWWWYCFDWTCERFSFGPHWGLNLGHLDL